MPDFALKDNDVVAVRYGHLAEGVPEGVVGSVICVCFSGCRSLATIYAASTCALLPSGISGSQCF